MELRRVTELEKHQETIRLIVFNPDWPAIDKAKMLGANALIFQKQKDVAGAYSQAARTQQIYHLLHDSNLSFPQLLRSLAKYRAEELASAIVFDKSLSIRKKVAWLGDLRKCSPALSEGLLKTYREQSAQLAKTASQKPYPSTPKKTVAKIPQPDTRAAIQSPKPAASQSPRDSSPTASQTQKGAASVSLESFGFSPVSLAVHSGVSHYAKHILKMEPDTVLSILQEHWADISRDFAKIESDRNGRRGPGRVVPPKYVASMLARLYLNGQARRMPPAMMEAIIGKESNWNKDAVGNFDMGPFQLNKSSVADMCQIDSNTHRQIRMNEVNSQMRKWGLRPFDIRIGQYFEKGSGWKKLEFDTNPKSRYYKALCSPDALEMAAWVIVRKMLDNGITCLPDKMSEEQMQTLFRAYNSSSAAEPYASEVIRLYRQAQAP